MKIIDYIDIILTVVVILLTFIIVCLFALWRFGKEIDDFPSDEEIIDKIKNPTKKQG